MQSLVCTYSISAPIYASRLSPSKRGELEITDLNRVYLKQNKLSVEKLGRGIAWFDAGTQDSMMDASILFPRSKATRFSYRLFGRNSYQQWVDR